MFECSGNEKTFFTFFGKEILFGSFNQVYVDFVAKFRINFLFQLVKSFINCMKPSKKRMYVCTRARKLLTSSLKLPEKFSCFMSIKHFYSSCVCFGWQKVEKKGKVCSRYIETSSHHPSAANCLWLMVYASRFERKIFIFQSWKLVDCTFQLEWISHHFVLLNVNQQ